MATKKAATKKAVAKKAAKKTTKRVGKGQTFSIHAPTAMSVLLAGDFTHWQKEALPMAESEKGIWSVTVALAPGTYHYRFIVDGEWRDDPECLLRVPNTFGSQDNIREVR